MSSCESPLIGLVTYKWIMYLCCLFQILFARAEGLHAHGHTREACKLARRLAEEILTNPPDFNSDNQQQSSGKGIYFGILYLT